MTQTEFRSEGGAGPGAETVRRARALLASSGAAAGAMDAFEGAAEGAAAALKTAASAAARTARATAKAAASAARYAASFDEIERLPAAPGGSSGRASGKTAQEGGAEKAAQRAPAPLDGLRARLAGFWSDFAARLAPAAAAWSAAWRQIRQAAQEAWRQITAAAGTLWEGTLAPLLTWLAGVFAPGVVNSFSEAFAPIVGGVLTAGAKSFAFLFEAACGGIAAAVQTVLMPALALALEIWQGLMAGIRSAWETWGQPILAAARQAVENLAALAANLWTTVLEPVLTRLMAAVQTLWEQHLQPLWDRLTQLFGAVTEMALSWWNNVLTPFLDWLVSAFGPLFAAVFAGAGDAVTGAAGVMADAVTTALRLFQGLAEFLSNVFEGDWAAAWASVQNTVTDVWAGIQNTVRGAVNGVIGFVNGMLRGVAAGINAVAAALNSLSFTVPDWVPGIGGSRFGVSIGTVTAPQIPMLASGGVIRQPTLAMMGEYAGAGSDPEIAAPQSAIAQAVSDANGDVVDAVLTAAQQIIEAIRENGGEIVIGDEAIGRAARRYNSRRAIMTGGAAY